MTLLFNVWQIQNRSNRRLTINTVVDHILNLCDCISETCFCRISHFSTGIICLHRISSDGINESQSKEITDVVSYSGRWMLIQFVFCCFCRSPCHCSGFSFRAVRILTDSISKSLHQVSTSLFKLIMIIPDSCYRSIKIASESCFYFFGFFLNTSDELNHALHSCILKFRILVRDSCKAWT